MPHDAVGSVDILACAFAADSDVVALDGIDELVVSSGDGDLKRVGGRETDRLERRGHADVDGEQRPCRDVIVGAESIESVGGRPMFEDRRLGGDRCQREGPIVDSTADVVPVVGDGGWQVDSHRRVVMIKITFANMD